MAEITGVAIADITAAGWTDDGRHIWITHRLRDGTEYRLIYPSEAAAYLATTINHTARSAYRQLAAADPRQAAEGLDTNALPVEAVRVAATPEGGAALLHLTTADNVPIAVELPAALLEGLAAQLERVVDDLRAAAASRKRLH